MKTKKWAKKLMVLGMVFILAIGAISVDGTAEKARASQTVEFLYQGTLDISAKSWSCYYAGLNYNMTGGTAGALYQGTKLLILAEKTNRSGIKICYCYSESLGKNCYVSSRYIKKSVLPEAVRTETRKGTLNIAFKGWNTYYAGLNYNMTGGTAGALCQGAELVILAEQKNKSNNLVYYCYSESLKKNCYVSAKYVIIEESSSEVEVRTDYRKAIVEIALREYKENGNKKLTEPLKYNYYYTAKAGSSSSAWCSDFVVWCAEQAGVPMSVIPHEKDGASYKLTDDGYSQYGRYYNGYSLAYVPHVVAYLTKYCEAEYYQFDPTKVQSELHVPKPGDLIVYRTAKKTDMHIGLVVEVNEITGEVVTVEGNTSYGSYKNGCIAKKYVNFKEERVGDDWYIQGFISPKYE